MRAGIIGLDTSHAIEFAKIFNDPSDRDFADVEVVVGYPGGTDIPISRDRVQDLTAEVRESGITIVDNIPELLRQVDVVLLESVDGTVHLEQAAAVFQAGKPVFIDKPIAGSLASAIAIARLSKDHQVPCFSSSCIRYCPTLNKLIESHGAGAGSGAMVWGPCKVEPNVPDLFFYGVHGVEGLFQLMGTGCVSVQRTYTTNTDIVTGIWSDGRIGTYRGDRTGDGKFGATLFGDQATATVELTVDYRELCLRIAEFFRSGKPPVALDETIEIFAFMEAADESKRQAGKTIELADVLASNMKAAQDLL